MEPVFISNRGRLKRKMAHRVMGILLSAAMVFNVFPAGGFAVHASEGKAGLCEHHTAHTDDCGYEEETPGTSCGHERKVNGGAVGREGGLGCTEDCCTEVQEAPDAVKTPVMADEIPENAVAEIKKGDGTTAYVTADALDDAFKAENSGAVITLLANVERTTELEIKIDCTLDLGGRTINCTDGDVSTVSGTEVIIQGEGGISSEKGTALIVGGTVKLKGGVFSGTNGVYVERDGVLYVSGDVKIIGTVFYGLLCQSESVHLSGGTFQSPNPRNMISPDKVLKNLLETGYAYFYNGQIPVTDDGLNGTQFVSWDYTSVMVKKCGHIGDGVCEYTQDADTLTHTKTCLACAKTENENCGFEQTAEPAAAGHTGQCPDCKRERSGAHSFSDWTGDPVAKICTVCGYEQAAVAKIENGSSITYVGNLDDAFKAENDGAIITLLADVMRTGQEYLAIRINCTLDLGGHTIYGNLDVSDYILNVIARKNVTIQGDGGISGTGNTKVLQIAGNVIIKGGTFSCESGNCIFVTGPNASLSITNSEVHVESTGGYGLCIGNASSSIQLSSGTYSGEAGAIFINDNNSFTLGDLLGHTDQNRLAYYQGSTLITEGLDGKALPGGTYTVGICTHDYKYTHVNGTTNHGQTCPACGDIKTSENCSFDENGECPCGAVMTVTLPDNLDLTYTGTAQTPAVIVTVDGTELAVDNYIATYANNTNAGTATVTVAGKAYTGEITKEFTIQQAAPALAWESAAQELTYTGREAMVTVPRATGPNGIQLGIAHDTGPCQYFYAVQGSSEFTNGLPINAGTYTIRASVAAKGNYTAAESANTLKLTINKAAGTLTVSETQISRKFGDAAFSLNCSTNGDGKISYASSDESVVSVSADGTALIKGTGTAVVTVSLEEGANYTGGAKDETIEVTVDKADAPAVGQETRNYTYTSGSKGAVAVDVAGKLPKDRGETKYSVAVADEKSILSNVSVDGNGNLTFTVPGGKSEGDTASVTVTAEMANYAEAIYTVEIVLVEKIAVEFTLSAQPQDSVYDGKPHNGYAGLAAWTVNGGYTGAVRFWYAGAGGTPYDSGAPPVRAGNYTVTASVPEDDEEYAGSSEAVPFTIRKAAVSIKADNKAAQAGGPLPELTYTISGLAEKEQLAAAPKLSCSADMDTAGIYPITAGGAKVPDTDNYQEEITYESGTLTVLDSAVHVEGVSLDKNTLPLSAGGTGRLTAAILPENATDKSVSWFSGSPAVASVDSSGNITAVSAGTAVIIVTTADGGYTDSCTVIVRKNTGGSSGSGGSSSSGDGSSGSTGSGTGQAVKQPFIKDSSGRKGWDVIRAEARKAASAPAGGMVAVDMNGAVSVPGSVLECIRGRDATLSFDMGGGIIWSVSGKDITADSIKDTDFSIKADAGAIPKELVEEMADGLAHLELNLAHEGEFGFTAMLTLRLVSRDGNGIGVGGSGTAVEYTGMCANLYYYNPVLCSLEFICAGKVGEDGTVRLPFTHASDYTVILSAAPMGGTGAAENPPAPQQPGENAPAQVKSVRLSKTVYTYSGKVKKPSVTAIDTEGRKISSRYYTVSYQNNKNAGKAAVTVNFKGRYSGTVKKTFTIRPAGTSIRKITAASGGFAVKWKKKTAQVSGYQIQYSQNKGFKGNSTRSVSVKKAAVTKKEVKNLKAGKKYYVRIRTYKTVKADRKNTKVYSAWSGAVSLMLLSPFTDIVQKMSVLPAVFII